MTDWLLAETSPGGPAAPYVARVAAIGRHLPAATLTTDELMASTRHRTRIDLERLTGIHERRVSTGADDSLSLATAAAADCLARAQVAADDIEVVLSCSITKYRDGLVQWLEPPTGLAVAQAIGAGGATTFDVANACAGMLTGVLIVNNWIRAGRVRRALVVSGEYISQLGRNAARHVRSILSPELASLTLGDAGAAVLVERARDARPGITLAAFTTIAEHSRLCLAYPSRHEPGARMFTKSRALQKAAIADTPIVLREALDEVGLEVGDIDHVIPHQTSARAIRSGTTVVERALGGRAVRAVVTVDRYGNTASTTHFVALAEELAAGRVRAGDRVALLAQASGLELGVVLLTVDDDLVEACRGNDD
jgi:3-oxoacyl-[acyl-carrier-protein] synthase-3